MTVQISVRCIPLNATVERMQRCYLEQDRFYLWIWIYNDEQKCSKTFVLEIGNVNLSVKRCYLDYLCKVEIWSYGLETLIEDIEKKERMVNVDEIW